MKLNRYIISIDIRIIMNRTSIIIPLIFLSIVVNAQSRIAKNDSAFVMRCSSPLLKGPSPLWIVLHKGNTFSIDTNFVQNGILEPGFINSINIMKDKEGLQQYGSAAKNGVIVIILIHQRNNKPIKALRKYLKEM
jgi:hypothetical protein